MLLEIFFVIVAATTRTEDITRGYSRRLTRRTEAHHREPLSTSTTRRRGNDQKQ
jgi:hypothetical protein